MKYIDAEKLKTEIEKLIDDAPNYDDSKAYLLKVCSIIDSLQQEQPEVDLEKEIDKYCEPISAWQIQEAPYTSIENCARHFYELGRTEGIKGNLEEVPSNVDLEKELQAFLCNYDYEFDDDPVPFDIATHFYELGLNARKEE